MSRFHVNSRSFIEDAISQLEALPAQARSDMHAVRPTKKALASAHSLVDLLGAGEPAPQPTVVATPDKGIELEWRRGSRMVAVCFLPDGSVETLKAEGNQVEETQLSKVNGRVIALIRWLGEAAN